MFLIFSAVLHRCFKVCFSKIWHEEVQHIKQLEYFCAIRKCMTSLDLFPFKLESNLNLKTREFGRLKIRYLVPRSPLKILLLPLSLVLIRSIGIFKHINLSIFKGNSFCSRIVARIMFSREEGCQGPWLLFVLSWTLGTTRWSRLISSFGWEWISNQVPN